jgi:hypothetical protein
MRFQRGSLASVLAAIVLAALSFGCANKDAPTSPQAGGRDVLSAQAAKDIASHFAASLSRQNGVPINRLGGTSLQVVAEGARASQALRSGAVSDEGGFSWSLSIAFFDTDENQQAGFIPGETTRLTADARVRGHMTTAEQQASIGVRRFLDVRGLLPSETELHVDGAENDTANAAFAALDGSASRRYDLLAEGSLEDLRQLKDASQNPYPLSGVLLWQVAADAFEQTPEGTKEAHYDAKVKVTFNGTRYPTIEVEKNWRYQMDLETGEITPLPA